MVRENILNLNGPWQWDVGPGDGEAMEPPFNTTLSGTILARCQLPHLLAGPAKGVLNLLCQLS